ncbi:hypothetical protein, partial [uncultured Endozoicomonas sp.]|uniref:hypothetical protein n=1 Tax=uncultured Endozoicomonas sp. TaxID=432652 RepID=UPI00260EE555
LPFAVCRLPFAVCRLPFAVCRLPFAVCRDFVVFYLECEHFFKKKHATAHQFKLFIETALWITLPVLHSCPCSAACR